MMSPQRLLSLTVVGFVLISVGFGMTDARVMTTSPKNGNSKKTPYYRGSLQEQIQPKKLENTRELSTRDTATLSGSRPSDSSSPKSTITVRVKTDKYPREIQWDLKLMGLGGSGDQLIHDVPQGQYSDKLHVYEQTVEIEKGKTYKFHIQDLARDGICCNFGNGYYEIVGSDGHTKIAGGDDFGDEEVAEIFVPAPPTEPPAPQDNECYDSPDGTFEANDVIGTQNCSWLVSNKEKYPWLCAFVDVALKCPSTCGICQHLRPGWEDAMMP
mmetsp:Transcript_4184/g.4642  ORF Transcript_4184/g.4642 Transcript_4184/m.4642 type:complete len:270 (-) Transcript_4184:161-970(-)